MSNKKQKEASKTTKWSPITGERVVIGRTPRQTKTKRNIGK